MQTRLALSTYQQVFVHCESVVMSVVKNAKVYPGSIPGPMAKTKTKREKLSLPLLDAYVSKIMSDIYRGTDVLTVIALREVTAAQWKLYSSLIKPRSQVQSQASSQNKKREPRIDSEKK